METTELRVTPGIHLIRLPLILGLTGGFLLVLSSTILDLVLSIGLPQYFGIQLQALIKIMAWIIIFGALAMLISRYLSTGFGTSKISIGELQAEFPSKHEIDNDVIRDIEQRIDELKSNQTSFELSEEERGNLLDGIREKISSSLEEEALDGIKSSIKKELTDERIKYLRKNLDTSMRRLSKEVLDLGRRGNINLIIGALATLAGFLIFGMMVLDGNFNPTTDNFIASFVPRLSLVILIEIFAYFFLDLYKSSLSEIKYFQNEITNIESKYAAMEYAVQYGDKDSVNKVLNQLANTERNFLLKKGESTVLLEQDRITTDSSNSFLQKITDLIGAAKSPNK